MDLDQQKTLINGKGPQSSTGAQNPQETTGEFGYSQNLQSVLEGLVETNVLPQLGMAVFPTHASRSEGQPSASLPEP